MAAGIPMPCPLLGSLQHEAVLPNMLDPAEEDASYTLVPSAQTTNEHLSLLMPPHCFLYSR